MDDFQQTRSNPSKLDNTSDVIDGVFSLDTLFRRIGGNIGPLAEQVRNAWGNQIWLDLLLAIGIAWFLIPPESKARGMRPWLWLTLIVCSGCVGFLAMLSRLLYLRGRENTVNIS